MKDRLLFWQEMHVADCCRVVLKLRGGGAGANLLRLQQPEAVLCIQVPERREEDKVFENTLGQTSRR